jgi:hypothetical protein
MISKRSKVIGAALLLSFSTPGCGGGGTHARTPEPPNIGAPDVPWHQKTHDEKQGFMAAQVEPTMRHLFQSYDAKGYAKFDCTTCHGNDMDRVDFKMPNSLYALSEKDPIAAGKDDDEKITDFMMGQVVPTFAKLLKEQPGSAAGVSCFSCHPKE